ncbi:MAG: hypothetical protein ACRCZP_16380 [Phycicoccus sp.]
MSSAVSLSLSIGVLILAAVLHSQRGMFPGKVKRWVPAVVAVMALVAGAGIARAFLGSWTTTAVRWTVATVSSAVGEPISAAIVGAALALAALLFFVLTLKAATVKTAIAGFMLPALWAATPGPMQNLVRGAADAVGRLLLGLLGGGA